MNDEIEGDLPESRAVFIGILIATPFLMALLFVGTQWVWHGFDSSGVSWSDAITGFMLGTGLMLGGYLNDRWSKKKKRTAR